MYSGEWTVEPAAWHVDGARMTVTPRAQSDAWRHTSYGFVHDDAHALLTPLDEGEAIEVAFILDFAEQFDQAGVMVRADAETWVKAGVEVSDGAAQVGAVVTLGRSDWSVAPVEDWVGREVTIRVSRGADSLTIRARADDEPWRLVRVAPFPEGMAAGAGPFCCSPTHGGLTVTFTGVTRGPADSSLH